MPAHKAAMAKANGRKRDILEISGIRWKCETRAVYFSWVKVFEAITQNGPSANHFKITKNEHTYTYPPK